MSRNLIFNTEFQHFIIPGNFQEFSGTLDIAWKWPFFCQFWHIGHQFHLIFVTELEFGLSDWKMSFSLIISSNFWIWIPGFQKWPGIGHFWVISICRVLLQHIELILRKFGDNSWFLDPGFQNSRILEVPWNWLVLSDINM